MIAYIELTSDGSAFKNTYILPHGDRVRQGNGFTLHVLIKNGYSASFPNNVVVYADAINGTANPDAISIYSMSRNAGYYFHKLYPTEITYGLKEGDSCTEYVIEIPRDSQIVAHSGSVSLGLQAYYVTGENTNVIANMPTASLSVEKVYAKPREHSNITQTQADALASLVVNNFDSRSEDFVLEEAMFDKNKSKVTLSARPANGFGIVSGKVVTNQLIEASNIDDMALLTYNVRLISELPNYINESAQTLAEYVADSLASKSVEEQNAWVKNNTISSASDKAQGKIICDAQTAASLKSISDLGLISCISYDGTYGTDSESGYRYANITITYKNTRYSDWVLVGSANVTGRIKMISPSVSFADSLGYGEFRLTYEGPDANNPNVQGYIHLWIQKGITEIPAGSAFDLTIPIATARDYVFEQTSLSMLSSMTGYVPYSDASSDVDLGSHSIKANALIAKKYEHSLEIKLGDDGRPRFSYDDGLKTFLLPIDGASGTLATQRWVNDSKSVSYLHTVALSYQNTQYGYIKFVSSSYNEYLRVSDIAMEFNEGTIRDVKYSTDGDDYFLVYAMSSTGDIGYITFDGPETETVDGIEGYASLTEL